MTDSFSRRDFLKSGAVGLAGTAGAVACRASAGGTAPATTSQAPLADLRSATPRELQNLVGDARKRRILLRGGVVLTLDRNVGDFARADVLIDGKTISAIAPEIPAGDAEVIDCSGTIVMPGFITTHNHQYEAILRSLIPDGILAGAWPLETYGSVVQNIWTAGPDCRARESGQRHLGSGAGAVRPRRLLHRAAALLSEPDHRRRDVWNRHLAGQSHTRAHRRHDQGHDGLRPPDGLRLQRRNRPERRWIPIRGARRDERHDEGHRPDREDVLQFEGSAGHAGLRRRTWTCVPGCVLHRLAARSLVRRLDQQPQCRQRQTRHRRCRRSTQWHRLVRRDLRPRDEVAGQPIRTALRRFGGLSQPGPLESMGDRARPGCARLDRQSHRDADAARNAAASGGVEPRHPAEPESRRRYQHDDGSVLADARRLLPAARARQRPGFPREQPWQSAGPATAHLAPGH